MGGDAASCTSRNSIRYRYANATGRVRNEREQMKFAWNDSAQYLKPVFIAYFISNVIGLFLYFIFCTSISDLAHQEQRNYYDGVDGITYFCTAVPVLGVCFLVNALWGIKALKDITMRNDFHALVAGSFVATLWAAGYGFCSFLARVAIQNGINHFSP
jgi:hypothetical protein